MSAKPGLETGAPRALRKEPGQETTFRKAAPFSGSATLRTFIHLFIPVRASARTMSKSWRVGSGGGSAGASPYLLRDWVLLDGRKNSGGTRRCHLLIKVPGGLFVRRDHSRVTNNRNRAGWICVFRTLALSTSRRGRSGDQPPHPLLLGAIQPDSMQRLLPLHSSYLQCIMMSHK